MSNPCSGDPCTFGPACEVTCRGDNLEGQAWFDIWDNNNCTNVFNCLLFNLNGEPVWNPKQLPQVQSDFLDIFNKYLSTNSITNSGQQGYNVFQETLHDTCSQVPGGCDLALENIGNDQLCYGKTRDQIATSAPFLDFCGCFAPPADIITPNNVYNQNPQCDPLCSRINTIRLANYNTGEFLECNDGVCVIDNTSVAATKTSIGNNINFTQICNTCNKGIGCECILADNAVNGIENPADINQFCNTCYIVPPGGTIPLKTTCSQVVEPNTPSLVTSVPFWIVVVIFLVTMFIIALIILLKVFNNKNK